MGTVIISYRSAPVLERRGLAISLAFSARAGGTVVTPLLVVLVAHVGFQTAMLIASAIMLAVLVPVTFAWIAPPLSPSRPACQTDGMGNPLRRLARD